MSSHAFTRRLKFAYISTAAVIVILIVLGQYVIQSALLQEAQTRVLAATMAQQELRAQASFRNSILAVVPETARKQLNALKINPVASLERNLDNLERTNSELIGSSTPAYISKQMIELQPDFRKMIDAGRKALDYIKTGDRKEAGKQAGILFFHQQKYLVGTHDAYNDLSQAADREVTRVQTTEAIIAIVSLFTILFEALFVIRPALSDYRAAIQTMERVTDNREETIQNAKEAK